VLAVEQDINRRVAVLEVKVDKNTKSLESQNQKNDILIEMKTLMELQTEVNKEQKEQIKEFSNTLIKVNKNLDGLNSGMKDLNKRVTDIENKQDERKIDPQMVFKDVIYKVVPAFILAWLLLQFGLK